MSKDFSEYLKGQTQTQSSLDIDLKELENVFESKKYELKWYQIFMGNVMTTTALGLLTSPLQVIYTTFQLSQKRLHLDVYNVKNIMEANIPISQQKRLMQMLKYKIIDYNGVSYNTYHQVLQGIAEQGFLGFFKGAGTGIIHQILNSQLRYYLIQKYFNEQKIISNLYAASVAMVVDILTNPLMLIQSRLILQNRLPNFRTYPSIKNLFSSKIPYSVGINGHILKHIAIFTSQLPSLYIVDQRYSLMYLLFIQQLISYPFITVIRKLHCQSQDPFMLKSNYNGFLDATKQIYKQDGIRMFYRGFIGFAIANSFISFVLYSTQLLGENND